MCFVALWLWCSVVYLVHAQSNTNTSTLTFHYADTNSTINITEFCRAQVCMTKCCPEKKMFSNSTMLDSCIDSKNLTRLPINNLDYYSEIAIYDKNIKQEVKKARKSWKDFTRIYSNSFLDPECSFSATELFPPPTYQLYILEDGNLAVRHINYFKQWERELPPGEFCVEHQIVLNDDGNISPQLVIKILATKNDYPDISNLRNTVTASGMVVSSVFLVLVLAVYALLPELRNMAGLILMSYVTTQATAFLIRAVQVFVSDTQSKISEAACLFIGFISYYTIVATFTWMNVMSFDIWWSMRGFRKLRQIHRRGVLVKLCWYGLYGWGAPLLPVVFMIVVENIDMTHLPDFVTPHISANGRCYIGEDERLLYMNGPISMAIFVNITLFVVTVYNIWRIRHDVCNHAAETRRNTTEEARFIIYLKLALIMGINWIAEVVSPFYDTNNSVWWYIPDVFNSLTGVFVFVIFVCKRNILVLLCRRFSYRNELVQNCLGIDSSRNKTKVPVPEPVTDASEVNETDIRKCVGHNNETCTSPNGD